MFKQQKLVTLMTIALFAGTGSALAGDKGQGKSKGHGVGGVSAEHISEQGAAHRQYNAGGVADQHKKDLEHEHKHKVKDKEKKLKKDKEDKEKEVKKHKDKHQKEMKDKQRDPDAEKPTRRWWQFFGDDS